MKIDNKTRVRFWVWYKDSPVRLTVALNQTVETIDAGPTDEGWYRKDNSYTLELADDGFLVVTRKWCDDGRDCDGRLTRYGEDQCTRPQLSEGYEDEEHSIRYPAWQQTRKTRQHDEYAEMK